MPSSRRLSRPSRHRCTPRHVTVVLLVTTPHAPLVLSSAPRARPFAPSSPTSRCRRATLVASPSPCLSRCRHTGLAPSCAPRTALLLRPFVPPVHPSSRRPRASRPFPPSRAPLMPSCTRVTPLIEPLCAVSHPFALPSWPFTLSRATLVASPPHPSPRRRRPAHCDAVTPLSLRLAPLACATLRHCRATLCHLSRPFAPPSRTSVTPLVMPLCTVARPSVLSCAPSHPFAPLRAPRTCLVPLARLSLPLAPPSHVSRVMPLSPSHLSCPLHPLHGP
ncbi:hypothetical protein DENSPDRAFT_885942 [Dentipellis sp. KUC8613]|nr:hypothetical protein DENSPDRAFT_885942 [Dentipellis sp. KUC8613]